MNFRRGLFRLWLLLSIFWIVGASALAIQSVTKEIHQQKFQYDAILRDGRGWKEDWNRPFYELYKSPREAGIPKFREISSEKLSEFEERAKKETVLIVEMPDSSRLYLDSALGKDDLSFLAKEFWDQRWSRWWHGSWHWILWAFVPPVLTLAIGFALFWVFRGFRQ